MKKVFLILISLLVIGTINVKAEEDYNIIIDENNNFILTDSSNNQITDTTIAKYEENTLTLGEGKYFNQIKIKSDATITSNDKGVYIKKLTTKEDTTYIPANITINKLKVKEDDTYICTIDIGGNLIVNDSEINTKNTQNVKGYTYYINSKFKSSYNMNSVGRDEDGYGFKIINSNLDMENSSFSQIYPQNGGFYAKDSTITGSHHRISGYGDLYIENSNIAINYLTQQTATGKSTIKDSKIKAPQQIAIFATSEDQVVVFENSEIESGEIYAPRAGTVIRDCVINSTQDLFLAKNVNIRNTKANLKRGIATSGTLTIEDSEILGSFRIGSSNDNPLDTKTIIKNSLITTDEGYGNNLYGKTIIENTKIDIQKGITSYGNIEFNNCEGELKGTYLIFKNDVTINSSILKFIREEDQTANAVLGDLKINNSNVVFNHDNSNIPVMILGQLTLDDKIVPIDNEQTILKQRTMTEEEKNNYNFSRYYFIPEENQDINILVYDSAEISDYVKLATQKTATFKVKNGTWSDGTSDDIIIDYLYGEPLEVENLPKEVQELLTSKMGSWSMDLNNLDTTQDLDIEFKYDLINPETKRNLLVLFIITIISVVVFTKIKIKHVNHKKRLGN